MDVADSYKRMSGNGREKKTGSLSESAVRFLTTATSCSPGRRKKSKNC